MHFGRIASGRRSDLFGGPLPENRLFPDFEVYFARDQMDILDFYHRKTDFCGLVPLVLDDYHLS